MDEIREQAGDDDTGELLAEDLWSIDKTARFLGRPKGTLYQWRHNGTGPRSVRVGGSLMYAPADVRAYLLKSAKGEAA